MSANGGRGKSCKLSDRMSCCVDRRQFGRNQSGKAIMLLGNGTESRDNFSRDVTAPLKRMDEDHHNVKDNGVMESKFVSEVRIQNGPDKLL